MAECGLKSSSMIHVGLQDTVFSDIAYGLLVGRVPEDLLTFSQVGIFEIQCSLPAL